MKITFMGAGSTVFARNVLKASLKKSTMLILAVTIHNIPEGISGGAVFAQCGRSPSQAGYPSKPRWAVTPPSS